MYRGDSNTGTEIIACTVCARLAAQMFSPVVYVFPWSSRIEELPIIFFFTPGRCGETKAPLHAKLKGDSHSRAFSRLHSTQSLLQSRSSSANVLDRLSKNEYMIISSGDEASPPSKVALEVATMHFLSELDRWERCLD